MVGGNDLVGGVVPSAELFVPGSGPEIPWLIISIISVVSASLQAPGRTKRAVRTSPSHTSTGGPGDALLSFAGHHGVARRPARRCRCPSGEPGPQYHGAVRPRRLRHLRHPWRHPRCPLRRPRHNAPRRHRAIGHRRSVGDSEPVFGPDGTPLSPGERRPRGPIGEPLIALASPAMRSPAGQSTHRPASVFGSLAVGPLRVGLRRRVRRTGSWVRPCIGSAQTDGT